MRTQYLNSFQRDIIIGEEPTTQSVDEVELDKLAANSFQNETDSSDADGIDEEYLLGFKAGYRKAALQVGYSIEDIEKAFESGYSLAAKHETNYPEDALTKEDYLNSIKK